MLKSAGTAAICLGLLAFDAAAQDTPIPVPTGFAQVSSRTADTGETNQASQVAVASETPVPRATALPPLPVIVEDPVAPAVVPAPLPVPTPPPAPVTPAPGPNPAPATVTPPVPAPVAPGTPAEPAPAVTAPAPLAPAPAAPTPAVIPNPAGLTSPGALLAPSLSVPTPPATTTPSPAATYPTATPATPSVIVQPPAALAAPNNAVPADPFVRQLELAIEVTSKRYLTANTHSPWQIYHGTLALGRNFKLKLGNEKVSAVDWIATSNPRWDGDPWIVMTPHGGKFHPFTRAYAFEGHPAQSLALLTNCGLPADFVFKAGNQSVTIADMLHVAMQEVNTQEECTWVLWALCHYLKTSAAWTNQRNEQWSIERLVEVETNAPVEGAACGGNHRLFAITKARDKYLRTGGKLQGVWFSADQRIKRYQETARALQNSDGTFSADFYKGPKFTKDLNGRLNHTGHTLEFLAYSLPVERLSEPWVRNSVNALTRDLIDNRKVAVDCGPLYHSLHALIIYRDRLQKSATTALKPDLSLELPAQSNLNLGPESVSPASGSGAPELLPAGANENLLPAAPRPGSTPPVVPEIVVPATPEGELPPLPLFSQRGKRVLPVSALEPFNRWK